MTRLTEIENHIANMRELSNIVGAMRSLAGMRMQEAQQALPGIRRYAELVAAGIADTLLLTGNPGAADLEAGADKILVLCAAEHGFVGGFNERLFDAAGAPFGPDVSLFVLGSRGAAQAAERGCKPSWVYPMATRTAGTPETIESLSTELYRQIAGGKSGRVEIIYTRYRQGTVPTIERRLLLPLDAALLKAEQRSQPALHNLSVDILRERLVSEYIFARLTEAAVESVASENAARFEAMVSAHDNVAKKFEGFYRDARQARQSEITAELLDLVSGAEALGVR